MSSPQDMAGIGPGVLGSLVSSDVLLFILGSPSSSGSRILPSEATLVGPWSGGQWRRRGPSPGGSSAVGWFTVSSGPSVGSSLGCWACPAEVWAGLGIVLVLLPSP